MNFQSVQEKYTKFSSWEHNFFRQWKFISFRFLNTYKSRVRKTITSLDRLYKWMVTNICFVFYFTAENSNVFEIDALIDISTVKLWVHTSNTHATARHIFFSFIVMSGTAAIVMILTHLYSNVHELIVDMSIKSFKCK